MLDVGCGTGEVLQLLQERGIRRLMGVDASAGMIAEAQRNLPTGQFFNQEIDRLEEQIAQLEGQVGAINASFQLSSLS